jgi:hypothetical protein
VALFIALSGTAYASRPGANTISTGDLVDDDALSSRAA